MSHQLVERNPDLKQLRDEGYSVHVHGGFLVMREVPYVDSEGRIQWGAFASALQLAGDKTKPPGDHTVLFAGENPHKVDGTAIRPHSSVGVGIGKDKTATLKFSQNPPGGYRDYYHLMTTYAAIFSAPAQAIDPEANPRVYRTPDHDDEQSVFNYIDTATSRAEIDEIIDRLRNERVAIIGLGGTGVYVLDFVSKAPVAEIRTFDADEMHTHNAFRAPGAPSIEQLREAPTKVDHHHTTYSKIHRRIVAHAVMLDSSNLHLLDGVTFVFICIDDGEAKKAIIEKLEQLDVAFIDCGLGVEVTNGALGGIVRTTASVPGRREHVHEGRIPFANDEAGVYGSNIQIAELNALNAVFAIIKWKKIRGIYHDAIEELHSLYTIDGNDVVNAESRLGRLDEA